MTEPGRNGTRPESSTPREPDWYHDPEGRYTHQAYWDGEKWTGEIRPRPRPQKSLEDKVISGIAWIIIGVVVAFFFGLWAVGLAL
jgi:hypothetical protein